MKRTITTVVLGIALATSAALSTAADAPAGKPAPGMHSPMMGNTGMNGMVEMMGSCQKMMDKGGMLGNPSSMRLPPGNEKLEFQMHAEMMQKMGEIAARYAERIREAK